MAVKKRDHTKLLCDIGELSGLFSDTPSLEGFLQKTVEMVSEHMHSEVCSIYLYYEETGELVLKATKGLKSQAVGKVRLKLGEGLTGQALQELQPICVRHASQAPGYRYFPEIGEEVYESFLAVPIARGQNRIGAIVIQNSQRNYFTDEDIKVLRAITSQIANTIEMAKWLMELKEPPSSGDGQRTQKALVPQPAAGLKFIKGKVGSQGFALSESLVLDERQGLPVLTQALAGIPYTLEDLDQAVRTTQKQLEDLQQEIEEKLSDVASLIFTAQILMLKDDFFLGTIRDYARQGRGLPEAVTKAVEGYAAKLEGLSNAYLQERQQDVRDMGQRLIKNLIGVKETTEDYRGKIVVATDLYPSDILKLYSQGVCGLVLLSGGITSHLSILARSLQLPLVIAEERRLLEIAPGTRILLDARQGNIYVNPSGEVIRLHQKKEEGNVLAAEWKGRAAEKTFTKDGCRIFLHSNINLLGDLETARAVGAEGIGLYRSEFPFIVRSDFPSEEEQYVVYKKLVEGMPGKEITFRTLDIGGDKVLSYYDYGKEANPFLGMRSMRFSLKHQEVFTAQLRAILRAGRGADVRILFPMISSVDDFLQAKRLVRHCGTTLKKEKVPHHSFPRLGVMVELPAAVEIIRELAAEADFFSVGTNDFIQYMLAVDRTNEKVAEFYLPHHPSILRALKKVVQAAQEARIEVSVCGDMAHEERYIPYLLGIGIRKFSLDSIYIPRIQKTIEATALRQAERKTGCLLRQSKIGNIEKRFLKDF